MNCAIAKLPLLVDMSLCRYFKPVSQLPTADQAGQQANVLKEVNQAVARRESTQLLSHQKIVLQLEGTYAAENGNVSAVKKFKMTQGIGGSTVQLFKKNLKE